MDSADGDNVYLVTVTASDGSASKSQDVSITVVNTEERWEHNPDRSVRAAGRDSDNCPVERPGWEHNESTKWQWYRGEGTLGTCHPRRNWRTLSVTTRNPRYY